MDALNEIIDVISIYLSISLHIYSATTEYCYQTTFSWKKNWGVITHDKHPAADASSYFFSCHVSRDPSHAHAQ